MKFVKCNGHIINSAEIRYIDSRVITNSKKQVVGYDLWVCFKSDPNICIAHLVDEKTVNQFMDELMTQLNTRE